MENKSKLGPSGEGKEKEKSKCPVCKDDATLVCGGCQSVFYCSVDHQKKHWKFHQSSCVFFHIKDDPSEFTGAGKFCVASRDLKAGTLILEELPVLHMPSHLIHDLCITCAIAVPPKSERNTSSSCPKCNWPVCGTTCAEFPLHAANECQVFVANRIPYPMIIPGSQPPLSELAVYPLLMRTYAIMIQNPTRGKALMEMLECEWRDITIRNLEDTICDMMYPVTLEKIALASSHFPRIAKEDESLLLGLLPKLLRLTLTQGYSIVIPEVSTGPGPDVLNIRQRVADYVYKTARHFVHSCSPNCFWTVGTFPDFKILIRTSVAVKKGEKLTVSRFIYNEDFANGTRNRQKHFQDLFQLPCRCKLCLDPTEFGTNQSAVVCALCQTDNDGNSEPGYLLPTDPLNIADDAPWKCSKCKKITIASEFCYKLEEISLDLVDKYSENLNQGDKMCDAFIEMQRNKLVHPNHWLIQLAGNLIVECQFRCIDLMNTEEVSALEKLMHFLLDVKNKIFRGIIHERMVLMYYLSRAMCHRLLSPFAQKGFSKELYRKPREDLLQFLVEAEKCQQYQNEALLHYKHTPNIGRGATVDHRLSTLRSDIETMKNFKFDILGRLTEIEIQRLRLGIN